MTPPRKPAAAASAPKVLELQWSLHELPSSQHRAGLLGLALNVDSLAQQRGTSHICEIAERTASTLTLRIDRDGMQALFDHTYGADNREIFVAKPYRNSAPKREEPRTFAKKDRKGNDVEVTETRYVYDKVIPTGAWLTEVEPDADPEGPWIKLWRDFVWSILRGVPATRGPFNQRANREPATDGLSAFDELAKYPDAGLELPGTYALGAQARSADNVPVLDRARYRLLLHFWPYAAYLFVPNLVGRDGSSNFKPYAVAVPDVAHLDIIDHWRKPLEHRSSKRTGYYPRDAIVDVPAIAGLEVLWALKHQVPDAHAGIYDLLAGIDVFHCEKEGNNVRIRSLARIEPEPKLLNEYQRVRGAYWSPLFRTQRLANVLSGKPRWWGFDRLAATHNAEAHFDNYFRRDAREAFKESGDDTMDDETPKSLEQIVYQTVGVYLARRLDEKHQMVWSKLADDEDKKVYQKKSTALARDAFLAVRARTGADFVEYFSGTLSQRMSQDDYRALSRALLEDPAPIRTLTLLALAARG